MNSARKTRRVSASDPRSVLRAISGNSTCRLSKPSFETARHIDEATDSSASVELRTLRIDPNTTNPTSPRPPGELFDAFDESDDAPVDSILQIRQLSVRLRQMETELDQRESELNERMKTLDQTVVKQRSIFDQQQIRIDQQSSQVRCQQLQLMQLQSDIVKSYEATRAAVEAVVAPAESGQDTIAAIKTLKYELGARFDHVARRWEYLAALMKTDRVNNIATHSINDSVDWTGEC